MNDHFRRSSQNFSTLFSYLTTSLILLFSKASFRAMSFFVFIFNNSKQWTNCEKLMFFNIQLFCFEFIWDEKTNYFNDCCKQFDLNENRTKAFIILQWQKFKRIRLIRKDQDDKHSVNFSWENCLRWKVHRLIAFCNKRRHCIENLRFYVEKAFFHVCRWFSQVWREIAWTTFLTRRKPFWESDIISWARAWLLRDFISTIKKIENEYRRSSRT